jgi:regulation of enolase protein 1 (concanavalin A-like superfamily)
MADYLVFSSQSVSLRYHYLLETTGLTIKVTGANTRVIRDGIEYHDVVELQAYSQLEPAVSDLQARRRGGTSDG